jgi:hypothetical protein
VKIEAAGITFLTDGRYERYVHGLEVDVRDWFGREMLMADNPALDGGGCG